VANTGLSKRRILNEDQCSLSFKSYYEKTMVSTSASASGPCRFAARYLCAADTVNYIGIDSGPPQAVQLM
jgi:hypothetical protein